MSVRTLLSLLALMAGLWLFWEGLQAVIFITGRGSPLGDALFSPPTSIIRLVGSGLIILGAALLIAQQRIGQWLLSLGILLVALLAILMAASGADQSMWQGEAVAACVLAIFACLLGFVFRSNTHTSH